ncbi:enhanced serine sensitivity protein SseB C-terminal domain-containing protein [uncultured Dubosiella sp.]|uniref:enhanced serine sensitivity protein SseB C-terminal domain-containing protein n=1 Tax=uncultured Dubosiella sp. TaxID=1937011 RepID=UPI00259B4010|nr:enhanced serine sensitivity protein SseB C-terminal domain-containing protein [uncultured Dubosiella sp.]
MAPYNNQQLKDALVALRKEENQQTINDMARTLRDTSVLAPAMWDQEPQKDENGQLVFEPNTKIQLMIMQDAQGNMYFPMFTSFEELKQANHDDTVHALVLSFDQFMSFVDMAKGQIQGIVLDPFTENVPIDVEFLEGVARTKKTVIKPTKLKKGDQLQVREPLKKVEALISALNEEAQKIPSIQEVYLKERLEGDDVHWLVIVDMNPQDPKLFQRLGEACRGKTDGKDMEFIFSTMQVAQQIMADSTPIYIKN